MKDLKKICLGCMREKPSAGGTCPYCGFNEKKYERNSRWLPLQHILNGKYMVGKVIGEGGFGITYIGWDLNLEVRVAIKEYFPIGIASRETGGKSHYSLSALMGEKQDNYKTGLKKFMEEARSLSRFYRLDGIVAVKDLFFENETAYMVMEYLDGVTLKEYLKNHGDRISVEEALRIMEPVLRSLAEVHKAGIIHRDISTDNIMITESGETKLIDFGSARTWEAGGNRTFTIVLKHGYAPPEQYQTKGKQGAWTDIYAASATLYRMITGQLPPNSMDRLGGDTLQTFAQHGCKVPDYVEHAVIKKGLALQTGQRYASVEEFYADLYPHKKEGEKTQWHIKLAAAVGISVSVLLLLWVGAGKLRKNESSSDQTLMAKVETERVTETEFHTEKQSETESETGVETGPEKATETEHRTEKQIETETETAETVHETETERRTETEAETVRETETEGETETGVETETEKVTETELRAEKQSETETTAAGTFAIDETNFPDKKFRTYVQENIDTDKDGWLTLEELDATEEINVTNLNIKSLKGIELFTRLKSLSCSFNQLIELDVSRNTALESLSCGLNQIEELDVSQNTDLKNLLCYGNKLRSLDVSRNTALVNLTCYENKISKLDTSRNADLENLSCFDNELEKLDVSKNAELKSLWCERNELKELDISGNLKLNDLKTDLEESQIIRPEKYQNEAETEPETEAEAVTEKVTEAETEAESEPVTETEQIRYSLSTLNIRTLPDTETGEITGKLYAGDPVMVTGITKGKVNGAEADWYQILLADGSGYISASESYTTDNPDEVPAGEYIEAANPNNCMICLSNRPLTSKNSGTEAAVYKNVYTFCNLFNPNGNMDLESVSVSISKDGKAVTSAKGEFTDDYCSVGFIVPEAGTYVLNIVTKAADGSIETGWNTFEVLER